MKQSFIMSPKVDFAFKLLFGDEKNEGIQKAYEVLRRVSEDEIARMAYEAREAEIRDQLTREKVAREEGIEQGKIEVAQKLLVANIDMSIIVMSTGLSEEQVIKIKSELS